MERRNATDGFSGKTGPCQVGDGRSAGLLGDNEWIVGGGSPVGDEDSLIR